MLSQSFLRSSPASMMWVEIMKLCDNIEYIYLPTIMEGAVPRYTYKLEKGITADRHGMIIIRNEGILDILNK